MFILNSPYVSDLMIETLEFNQYPVLNNDFARSLSYRFNFWDTDHAVNQIKTYDDISIYSNTEDSISWVNSNLSFSDLPEKIAVFKNKVKFRELLSDMYPDFYFKEIDLNELNSIDINEIPLPFIIKPAIGFFSLGVHRVDSTEEWDLIKNQIKDELEEAKSLYSKEVMDTSKFIIEEIIDGEEFAVDAMFDRAGRPIIFDILKHSFSSNKDMSDRIYITSKEIIETHLKQFEILLDKIGQKMNLKNFPLHLELRINKNTGELIPIEINPMRFAGWCCTDIAFYAYGMNVYEYFFNQEFPDWDKILEGREGKAYYFTIADCPEGVNKKQVDYFDYDKFLTNYKKVLEVRKFDYQKTGVFAYTVAETDSMEEIDKILNLDFNEYIMLLPVRN